jgi:hypothetical protein
MLREGLAHAHGLGKLKPGTMMTPPSFRPPVLTVVGNARYRPLTKDLQERYLYHKRFFFAAGRIAR